MTTDIRTTNSSPARGVAVFRLDPRLYQIAVLSSLLTYGQLVLSFDLSLTQVALTLGAALVTQKLFSRFVARIPFEPKSALISALSLCLLLRASSPAWAALAAVIAVASKFIFRWRGKHLFNPTNFALVLLVLATDQVWVSPAQWGSKVVFAFALASAGLFVVNRSARSDVTLAFLACHAAVLFGRAFYLGDPLSIPLRQLQGGALVLFAFFMISDPKTTPDSRAGRFVFAALTAAGAGFVQFVLYRPNGLLYALVAACLLVPWIDRLLPGDRFEWGHPSPWATNVSPLHRRFSMSLRRVAFLLGLVFLAVPAHAFCGFYVAKGDTKVFNHASQVVMVRDGDRTVLTMANDFKGALSDFAVVIPVPTFLERGQIHVAEKALLDHLDAYSAPRLVEYFDDNPCQRQKLESLGYMQGAAPSAARDQQKRDRAKSLGVTIEASYTVGEYDILILSAKESAGLVTWLTESGYRLPPGAEPVVGSYLKQNMRFFVAKVNLDEQGKLGFRYLRPLQVAYESPKFMLPIRLGTVNADGPQELYIYALTKTGRVETTNYRTVKLATGTEIPVFVKDDFNRFYRDMFGSQVGKENGRAVFLEYAWDMAWCDPCAADPLSPEELSELGVFWLDRPSPYLGPPGRRPSQPVPAQPQNVFLTRLHVRYDRDHFPEDLSFQETGDRENFQGRYVIRHPWKGDDRCEAALQYRRELPRRFEQEAQNLARLTGWPIEEIRRKVRIEGPGPAPDDPWWKKIWD